MVAVGFSIFSQRRSFARSQMMEVITADSPSELLRQLASIDIAVPLRSQGRTKDHCQRWSICRFLSTFADSALLQYPLRVDPGDRPDFLLTSRNVRIGVEVTEAVATDLAKADALQHRKGYDAVRFFQRVLPGDPPLSRQEIEKIAKGEMSGEGWGGDSVERDWVDVMTFFSLSKAERFAQEGFRKYYRNWLLIYDNWELPALDEDKAALFFHSQLLALDPPLPFDRVFVECEKNIWQFSAARHSGWRINDVWSHS
jgi:hypothetical protein